MTLTASPAFPLKVDHRWNVISTPQDSPMRQVRQVDSGDFRTFGITVSPATSDERDNVVNHFKAQSGRAVSFSWTPPGESETTVVFGEDGISSRMISPVFWHLEFTLVEVRN